MLPNTCSDCRVSALHTALHGSASALHAHRYPVGTGALGDAEQYRHCGEACSNDVRSRFRTDRRKKEDDANSHALARFLAAPESTFATLSSSSGRSISTTRVIFSTVQWIAAGCSKHSIMAARMVVAEKYRFSGRSSDFRLAAPMTSPIQSITPDMSPQQCDRFDLSNAILSDFRKSSCAFVVVATG